MSTRICGGDLVRSWSRELKVDNQSDAMTGHQLQRACTRILSLSLDFKIDLGCRDLRYVFRDKPFLYQPDQIHRSSSHHGSHSLTSKTGSS